MITVEKFAYWLKIKEPDEDLTVFLQDCINKAISQAEKICKQELTYGLRKKYLRGNGKEYIYLNSHPVEKIDKLQKLTSSGFVDLISEMENIIIYQSSGKIILLNGVLFPNDIDIYAEYYSGYKMISEEEPPPEEELPDPMFFVPDHLKQAITILATEIFNDSNVRESRYGLQTLNWNAQGGGGKSFEDREKRQKYIRELLQSHIIYNI